MKIDQKNTTNKNTLSMTPPHPSNIPHTRPSPSDCTAGKYPELAIHPQMNSHFEANTLYCVRTPLALHPSCYASVCLCVHCVYCFPPPLFFGSPRCCRRLHRCWVRLLRRRPYPYRRATRQAEPHFLSQILPICLYLFYALDICCCCYVTTYSIA